MTCHFLAVADNRAIETRISAGKAFCAVFAAYYVTFVDIECVKVASLFATTAALAQICAKADAGCVQEGFRI